MSQTRDIFCHAPAIAITVGVLAFALGGVVEAQGNGCLMGVSCFMSNMSPGECGFRSGGGGDHCSCFSSFVFEDTCACSTGQYGPCS
jgi:hypothetical protein